MTYLVSKASSTADPVWQAILELTLEIDSGTIITEVTAPLEQNYSTQVSDLVLTGVYIRPGSTPGDTRQVTTTLAALVRNLQHALDSGIRVH